MFFSTYVLTKKGPLAKIWLAAHWDKKLTKNEVQVVNLRQTIVHIIHPVVPIAIRTSGELLIGVVRIYALKVKHLLREASAVSVQLLMTGTGKKAALVLDKKESTKNNAKINASSVTQEWAGRSDADENHADAAGGQFNAIADLLGGISVEESAIEEDILRAAWYAVEPVSQNESYHIQQDFDEIAKMKADLMNFGERVGSGSNSNSSKSKSSLSSIEKARGSHALGDGDDVPFPIMTDDLDIGMPLPEELPMEFPAFGGENRFKDAEDPFFIPELLPDGKNTAFPTITNTGSAKGGKKVRQVHLLDLLATTLPREEVEKNIADRSDIVEDYGARHGPGNEQECSYRCHLAGIVSLSDHTTVSSRCSPSVMTALKKKKLKEMDLLPFSSTAISPSLRQAFVNALFSFSLEPQLHSCFVRDEIHDKQEENVFFGLEGVIEAGATDLSGIFEPPALGSKRNREDQGSTIGLSEHASFVLKSIENLIDGPPQKKRRGENKMCTFAELCQDLRRREVAKTFVDVLTLISKRCVNVAQETDLGPLFLHLA